ncbi:hypothetical protein QBC39DRAFT_436050 [Podospora conica]|nr:hypothetical protein QBC39DRAFT_436050 [Schizothecium conicum]
MRSAQVALFVLASVLAKKGTIELPEADLPRDIFKTLVPEHPAVPIKPSLAYACLQSIPFDEETAKEHVEWLRSVAVWHSTADHLKDPPRGFLSESVDLLGGIDEIAEKIEADAYQNEFEFLVDVYTLGNLRTRDIHFNWMPQLLNLFTFQRGVEFASVSKDGRSLPEIYLHDDIKRTKEYKPSPVATIDNVPATEYLSRLALFSPGAHDPDARFNLLFPNVIKDANTLPASVGPEYLSGLLLPDTTTVRLQNKTILTFPNSALLRADFSNITNAESAYAQWGPASASTLPWDVPAWLSYDLLAKNYSRSFASYPQPLTATPDGQVAGFLPASRSLSDVAVLDVRSFSITPTPYRFLEFNDGYGARLDASVDLIRAARAGGRKKLILDLQGNGGGQWINTAALYATLFPGETLSLLWKHRAHPLLAALVGEADRLVREGESFRDVADLFPFNIDAYLRPDGTAWGSFGEWYGSGVDGATRASLFNLSTALFPEYLFDYKYRQPWEEAPYGPDDIVILLDGVCASSCAIFVEALVHGHGVKTVVVGGRPTKAPMQGVGMVKQGAMLPFPVYLGPLEKNLTLPEGLGFPSDSAPLQTPGTVVNEASMVPASDPDSLPLEVTYEAANCRLFYSFETMVDVEKLWEQVADVTWKRGRCVDGSTTEKDSRIGRVPPYTPAVEDRYKLGKGVGSARA